MGLSLPWTVVWLLTLGLSGYALYAGAVASGMFKDPLMSRFRVYGEERRIYPICRFLEAAGLASLMLSMLIANTPLFQTSFAPVIFVVFAFMGFAASVIARPKPVLRESLPRWYFELLRTTTRQERRTLGYAWLRIPWRLRWRLNGDQAAFSVWVDMVRLTVIYGAHDPNNPWELWG